MEEVAHVVEAREVDMAVLLPLVLLPLDRVPLILQSPRPTLSRDRNQIKVDWQGNGAEDEGGRGGSYEVAVGGLLPLHRHRQRRRGWRPGSLEAWGFGLWSGFGISPRLPPAPKPIFSAQSVDCPRSARALLPSTPPVLLDSGSGWLDSGDGAELG